MGFISEVRLMKEVVEYRTDKWGTKNEHIGPSRRVWISFSGLTQGSGNIQVCS